MGNGVKAGPQGTANMAEYVMHSVVLSARLRIDFFLYFLIDIALAAQPDKPRLARSSTKKRSCR